MLRNLIQVCNSVELVNFPFFSMFQLLELFIYSKLLIQYKTITIRYGILHVIVYIWRCKGYLQFLMKYSSFYKFSSSPLLESISILSHPCIPHTSSSS